MAEGVDPFEAAMASIGEDGDDQPAENETPIETPDKPTADPFDAALGALDSEAAGTTSDKPAADPFDAALGALGNEEAGTTEVLEGDDPFEAALQVAKTEHSVAAAQEPSAKDGEHLDLGFLLDIKLEVTFEVGRAKMFISDLLSLGQGSVIELHRLVGEELEIFVNGHLFAVGEVVVVNEKFGGRITKIIRPEERIQRLGANYIM